KDTIIGQIKKMGSSCDWSRMAYTLDETRTKAVRTIFKKMYDDGLIYRGERIVNWCPRCSSTLADDEVEYREEKGKLYYIKYGPLTIATTRPETKIGDTGAAVNLQDKRYKKYHGKELEIPLGKIKIKIKVVADAEVDPEFGTGVVGVTPGHSQEDFAIAERHKLSIKKVIAEDGKMTALAGPYAGLTVQECRKQFVKDLEAAGLIEKIEDYGLNLSVCYRCETPVEPLTSLQWFIDVNKQIPGRNKSLKQMANEVVSEGDINIIPERFTKTYFHWMENLRDWCISRQIWFGHQVPVWYNKKSKNQEIKKSKMEQGEEEIYVGVEAPKGEGWEQDTDTLDTWFSSGLWTFSTLGWPDKTNDLKTFHPTSVMETGYDTIFFWVARMIIMSTYALGEIPFSNVYLHGLIRDEQGRKMSKSLGNTIDPVEVADKFGTDAVRLSLVIGTSPGNDMNLSEQKIAGFRNFTNKLWNISRYIFSSCGNIKRQKTAPKPKTLADAWILSRFARVKEQVEKHLDEFQFSAAGETLRDFTWSDFADWYLEISKIEKACPPKPWRRGDKDQILMFILERLLIMWHPFMPFVTEAVWSRLEKDDLLMIQKWPEDEKAHLDSKKEKQFNQIKELITKVRNLRSIHKIEPAQKIELFISAGRDAEKLKEHEKVIAALTRASKIKIAKKLEKPESSLAVVLDKVEAYVPTEGLIDMEGERDRLKAEAKDLQSYIKKVDAKVNNIDFLKKAPPKIIQAEKERLGTAREKLARLKEQMKDL
ncbi:valine--tRNA ligase, partial [Patescibacteria group bacterium]|nr:valine--tRNA ligase [Patescibacteria group bacterium]MBU1921674.1 valine--tRNA ligase [Patescibacteria group bacterium]